MNSFKKQLIKSFINIRLVSDKPGELIIQTNALAKIGEEVKDYDKQVEALALLLDGIQEVTADYRTNRITIKYDPSKLTNRKVLKWLEIMIDVGIDNLEIIQKYGEDNPDYVINILENALMQKIKDIK